MNVIPTEIPGLLILEPKVFGDARGFFFESFSERAFEQATGIRTHFVQDNHSRSVRGVLRGLHYQMNPPQGKIVRVTVSEMSRSARTATTKSRGRDCGRGRQPPAAFHRRADRAGPVPDRQPEDRDGG